MAIFTGTSVSETITPSTVSPTVMRNPLGSLPSNASDTIYGNGGTDQLDGGGGDDTIYGGSGHDTIVGGTGNDVINAGDGNNTLDGGDGDDSISSGMGADTISGGVGNDIISAGDGTDTIDGGSGDDSIGSGAGADMIIGGLGNDYMDAGLGADTVSYANATGSVMVDLSLVTAQDTIGGGTDTLLNVENFIGSTFDDSIIGTVGNNVLNGAAGSDRVSYVNATAGVTVNLSLAGAQNTGGAGTDTLLSIEQLISSNFGDILTGDSGHNAIFSMAGDDVLFGLAGGDVLAAGAGHDILNGGDGNDALIGDAGNDTLNGGAGLDIASYGDATAGVTVNLSNGAAQNTGGAGTDTLVLGTIEELGGSMHNDVLIGDGGNNVLIGLAGDDQLTGGGGNDLLIDDAGDDTLNGGAGQDRVSYHVATGAVEVNLAIGGAQDTVGAGIDQLISIENLGGSDFNDILTGDSADNQISGWIGNDVLNGGSGNDTLSGGIGDDTLNGGNGTDTAFYTDTTVGVTVSLGLVAAQNTVGAGVDTLVNMENLTGSSFNDTLTGNSGNNILEGLVGNDVLNGGGGTDTASYSITLTGVTVSLLLVGAQDTVGAGMDTLSNFENLWGSNFNDTLTGNAGNNILVGGLGNDGLNGDAGIDMASYETATTGVTVSLLLAGVQNTIGAGTDTLSNFENLKGSNLNDTLTGNAGSNLIIGGLGNDLLNGDVGIDTASYETATTGVTVSLLPVDAQNTVGAGTDTLSNFENMKGSNYHDTLIGNAGSNLLIGGLGDDVLNGSAGADTVSYETATMGVTVSLLLAAVQNTVGAGMDTLVEIENLTGSAFNDTLMGNAIANIFDGKGGDDLLNGGVGADTATYASATAGVTVNLGLAGSQNTGAAGVDTLVSLENLIGSAFNDTLTGNSSNNVLNGLAGNDTLIGLDGHDILKGGLGNDTLSGNSGSDNFVFNQALNGVTNKDTITDFAPVDDTLVLENAIFTQFVATGAIPAGTFVSGAGAVAVDANDYLIYNTTTGTLSYDVDGNGAGTAVAVVTLLGSPALTAADFTII